MEQKGDSDEQNNTSNSVEVRNCLYCKNTITNPIFAPYCSLGCAKSGTQKRYALLRNFINFESKYINPPKKPDNPQSTVEKGDKTEDNEKKDSKKQKKLPRVEYSQFVPTSRQKSRKLLLEALQKPYETDLDLSSINYQDIAYRIEQALYNLKPYFMNSSLKTEYTSKLRELIFNLSDSSNPDLRNRLFSDEVEPERLPLMSANDLASSELRKWREEKERKHIAENVMLTSETDRSFLPLSVQGTTESKPVEETPPPPPSTVEVPKEPEPQVTIIQNDLTAEREKQMAALLESIPTVISKMEEEKPKPEEASEVPKTAEEEKKESSEEKPEEEEKPVEMMELSLKKNSTSVLSIAMPDGKPVVFNATVIDTPPDLETSSITLEKLLSVIGRMSVTTCEAYLTPRKESVNHDVIWWILELDKQTDENELQRFLKNFVPDKRLGVLETGVKEKNLYFVPPSLDPITASPISTLSSVADGSYKQFCHLLYIRKRFVPRPKPLVQPPTPKQPHTPPGSPPPSAYRQNPPPFGPPGSIPPPGAIPGAIPPPGSSPAPRPLPNGSPNGPVGMPNGFPPLGPDGRPMYPRGPDGRPMYPRGPPPGFFPRGPDGRPMFPRGPDGRPMYPPRGVPRPPYPPRGIPRPPYPPRGPGGPMNPNIPPNPNGPNLANPPNAFGYPPIGPDGRPMYPPRYPQGGFPPQHPTQPPRPDNPRPSRSRWDERQ